MSAFAALWPRLKGHPMMLSVSESQEERCRGCGLMVQPGYSRCPRCKMPQQGPGSMDAAGRKTQGGTVVESGSNRVTLIALGLLLTVVVAVVLVGRAASSEETDSTRSGTGDAGDLTTDPDLDTSTPPSDDDTSVGFTDDDEDPVTTSDKELALESIQRELGARRYWSTVTADPETQTIITVSSSSCTDPDMKSLLTNTGPQLLAVGFVTLRCAAKHGGLVFELEL